MSALNIATKRGFLVYSPLARKSFFASTTSIARVMSTSAVRSQSAPSSEAVGQVEIAQRARANRPLSPDLTIYQPQLTWYLSSLHRITGAALAAGLYGGAIAYVASPIVLGMPFDSASIISTFAALPAAAKFSAKLLITLPFTFHAYNGIRHLIWDTASALTLKGVYATGYTVLGATLLTSGLLAAL
ncbi:hypothetical protein H4R33_004373 [Dimargaris cristalligena]|uniref:Succinate dehydrogenase cytochrome b560 subunit n=1 Tax=Dimargaris cristalligena TaxID=215637 RepID=A0A4P9ZWC7_9FUNG|nr:hypothetical protein H4R33_004373 [Dimargaris cristalligena]RKP37913.1 succinate dehydrogenase cytochrome b560 subunit [Dimargaris cristalligena]|eukprot:RKP37913.1 succinate dehydrogenase cytochrome b560 subunit [Dimargaris cristalligena]